MRTIPPVQRPARLGRVPVRRVYTLPLEQVRPLIRVAHRQAGAMNMGARLIVDHEFVLILAGAGEFIFPEGRVPFAPRDLFLIPPFVPHAIRTTSAGESGHLAVHFDFAPGVPAAGRSLERRTPYEVRFPEGLTVPRRTVLMMGDRVEQEFTTLVDA